MKRSSKFSFCFDIKNMRVSLKRLKFILYNFRDPTNNGIYTEKSQKAKK